MPPAANIFSTLPDPLIALILSKIPIREAVRFSILCKRWRFLYTQIPQLTLSPLLLLGSISRHPDPLSIAMVENIISNLLLLHSADLEAFQLCNYNIKWGYIGYKRWQFSHQSVSKWVRFAACRNIQHLTLCTSVAMEDAPSALFSCTRLTTLELFNCIITHIPTHFSGFNHLATCKFTNMEFTDDSLSCFSQCPLLHKLAIIDSIGLQKPVVSAPNLTHLVLHAAEDVAVLIVNCPRLITLEVCRIQDLRGNGMLFGEISYDVENLQMQRGTDLTVLRFSMVTLSGCCVERYVEIVGTFKALKELCIPSCSLVERGVDIVVGIDKMLQTLPNLELLDVPCWFVLEIPRDQMPPCLNSALANLLTIKIRIPACDEAAIALLRSILRVACVLEIMELRIDEYGYADLAFLRKLSKARRAYTRARINLII